MKRSINKQFKILIADDHPDNIQVIGNTLRAAGYSIGFATDGQQALQLLKQTADYDLILLDVDMPVMNGFEACKVIKADTDLKDIPVVFLTAFTDVDHIVAGFDAGAQDYLTKPFNSRELLARVNTHLLLKYKTDQVNRMNQLLEQKNRNITDSIIYASRIQQALLSWMQTLSSTIPDHFVLYKPKDIVSGDFYWFRQTGNYLYVAAADCTGHGVPGAFMSVLGISSINEIIKHQTVLAPNLVLNELRKTIIASLTQKEPEYSSSDGMDIALCLIDLNSLTLQYAGAFRPLIIIRKNPDTQTYELTEVKGDQMPLGRYYNADAYFTAKEIQLISGDSLYLFTDGYSSQFGSKNRRKYNARRFRELLLSFQHEPMAVQKQLLEQAFADWKGNTNQTDDILVIGLKINR